MVTPQAERAAQGLIGARATDGDSDDGTTGCHAMTEGHLDCCLVGRRQAGRKGPIDPFEADRNHQVVRKITPCPPSGYDQVIAPSWLHTR